MIIQIKSLLKFQIYYLLIVEALISLLHFPSGIRYLLDLNVLVIITLMFIKRDASMYRSASKDVNRYMIAYMLLIVVFAILRLVPIGQMLWAVRNNFFYIFFGMACVRFFEKKDVDKIIDTLVKFQVLNFLCGMYEYFVLHIQNDFLGGMFGTEQGCNGYLNVYLVFISVYAIIMFLRKRISVAFFLWLVVSSMVLATLGELKIFYFEFVFVIVLVVLLEKKDLKTFFIVIGGIACIFIGLQILSVTSTGSMQYLNSIEDMIEYGSRADFGNGDVRISRLTAIAQVNEYFFKDNRWLLCFGYGLGACEDSTTFTICNSAFADRYSYLQYRNISSSMLYLETGMVGLVGFIGIFIMYFYQSLKNKKILEEHGYGYIATMVQIMSLMTIVIIWYNSAIRREIAYLTFLILSLMSIYLNHIKDKEDRSEVETYDS